MSRELGSDWALYQGNSGKFAPNIKFVIAQIGGTYGGSIKTQSTYGPQIASAKRHGLRAHTYIWYQVGSSLSIAKAVLDYFLPRIQTPKGSIVALDYEAAATGSKTANTNAIMYGMKRIKAAGYTPMLYSGQSYLQSYVYTSTVIKSFANSLWVARYPDYKVRNTPDFGFFPVMDGVGIWQFTSTQIAGGLDGNVDLVGITHNGYSPAPVQKAKPVTKPVIKKVDEDEMQPRKHWPVDYEGVAYPYEDDRTYYDTDMKKVKGSVRRGKAYRIIKLRSDVTDLGSQWAFTGNLNCNLNPLPGGGKNKVYNAEPAVKTCKDGSKVTIKPSVYWAFGLLNGGLIDLGGGETGNAADFTVLL